MLVPAVLYKNEILTRMQEYYYTDDFKETKKYDRYK